MKIVDDSLHAHVLKSIKFIDLSYRSYRYKALPGKFPGVEKAGLHGFTQNKQNTHYYTYQGCQENKEKCYCTRKSLIATMEDLNQF